MFEHSLRMTGLFLDMVSFVGILFLAKVSKPSFFPTLPGSDKETIKFSNIKSYTVRNEGMQSFQKMSQIREFSTYT